LSTKWTVEEKEQLIVLRADEKTPAQIAHTINDKYYQGKPFRTDTAVRRYLERKNLSIEKCRQLRQGRQKLLDHFALDILETAKNMQKLFAEELQVVHEFTYSVQTKKKWIGIVHTGDWHIEGSSVDLGGLERDIIDIANYPEFYTVFMGDGGDYFIGGLAINQFDSTLPPRLARRLFFKFMTILGKRIIAVLTGDHEWFANNLADFDIISEVAKDIGSRYMGWGGTIHIETEGAIYIDAVRHRYRFNSSFNPLHTNRRYLQMEDSRPEIVAIAHNHLNAICTEELLGKKRILLRTGTRKVTDRYLQKKSFLPKGDVAQTNVILLCTEHPEMRAASSIEEGIDLIEFLNSKKEI
jgi:hypothetical protein